ncbi:MAG: universal stress protein [Thermanaerothrix sp.]|uniref:universal stress protein n=1 Tax=Thermanaerothrix sp. TaxID=2972675 RepID=UPI003C7AFD95
MDQARILIAIEVQTPSFPALDLGVLLAESLRWPVDILCIGHPTSEKTFVAHLDRKTNDLSAAGLMGNLIWGREPFVEAILGQARPQVDTLLIFSDTHRPRWRRWAHSGRFRQLQAAWPGPLLRVRRVNWPWRHLLVCSGGLDYTVPLERFMLDLGLILGAHLTVLHVVEPITLNYPLAQDVQRHQLRLLETHTPQARHFEALLDRAAQLGVPCELKVRYGPVVREIRFEIRNGEYDLIGMGSPLSARSLRRLFRPEVTTLVNAGVEEPLLIMRRAVDPPGDYSRAEVT